ncbi:MAG: Stealth CR1 domain-containing protein [Oscillospiraceae bacterium]|nr:Stealth CR1 domain-containing protein [Oscillospiraceae bacterium]
MREDIDFVIIWVDGNDPEWRKEKNECKGLLTKEEDDSDHRYRDWDNLQYWFRGVEQFCPWVRTVHFVTWGHLPKWLNTNHPKLHIVNHKDYIPPQYLPTFSSHTIELNLHRIEGLSEHFVYFNDDMFIIKPMRKSDFFHRGKPCDSAVMNVHCYNMEDMVIMAPFRDIGVINHEFSMRDVIKKNPGGWFNLKYGIDNLRNVILLSCPRFPGMLQQHLPTSFCKSTFSEVWAKYPEILNETCMHKFREMTDVNQWLFKEWQIASGNFYPRSTKIGKNIAAYHIDAACRCIHEQQAKMLCLNDTQMGYDEFMECVRKVNAAFDHILPEKSLFEL